MSARRCRRLRRICGRCCPSGLRDCYRQAREPTPTGAFKVRGGLVYVDRLSVSGRTRWADLRPQPNPARHRFRGEPLPHAVTIFVRTAIRSKKNRAMGVGRTWSSTARISVRPRGGERRPNVMSSNRAVLPSRSGDGVATYAFELLQKGRTWTSLRSDRTGSGICGCILARDLLGSPPRSSACSRPKRPLMPLLVRGRHGREDERSDTACRGMATRVPDADALAIIRKGASRIVQVPTDEIAWRSGAVDGYA